jgi:hypothetical protein
VPGRCHPTPAGRFIGYRAGENVSSIKDKLAKARLPERTIQLCLNGDLVARHEEAERELEQAQRNPGNSLAGNGAAAIAERIEALEAEMRESTETFVLRALPQKKGAAGTRPTWRELLDRHPPRRGDDGEILEADKGLMVNTATFYEDMVRECTVSPEMDDDDWDALFGVISSSQYQDLHMAAWLLNRGDINIPFSRAASRMRRATDGE